MRGLLNNISMFARLGHRSEIRPVRTCSCRLRVENEGLVAYVSTCERFRTCQRVIQGKNHPEGFGGDGFSKHTRRGVGISDKGCINLTPGKDPHQVGSESLMKMHPDIWVVEPVPLYLVGKPQWERGAREPNVQRSALTAANTANLGKVPRGLQKNHFCTFTQHNSCGSQLHRPGRPMEKPGSEIRLQFSDMSGQGRLRNSKCFRCAPEVEFRGQFDEGPEMPKLYITSLNASPSSGFVTMLKIHTVILSIMYKLLLDYIDPFKDAYRMNQEPSQDLLGQTARAIISPLSSTSDAYAFRELNEEWISKLFALEDADRLILGDPQSEIIDKGGQVLLARTNGIVVGCVALVPAGNGVFELSKMTVSPSRRGKGLGRAIVMAAIGKAREMGASTLFLGSSTKLANAVRLYESVGFRHVPLDELGPLPYRRADVFMKYEL